MIPFNLLIVDPDLNFKDIKVPDLTTSDDVVSYMSESTSAKEWNSRCIEVKIANDGDYPSFWFKDVILSGVADTAEIGWKMFPS